MIYHALDLLPDGRIEEQAVDMSAAVTLRRDHRPGSPRYPSHTSASICVLFEPQQGSRELIEALQRLIAHLEAHPHSP